MSEVSLRSILGNCAYWAANGLHGTGDYSVAYTMLENILRETKPFRLLNPGYDSNLMYEGFEYTYIPAAGFHAPQIEMMDNG